MLMNVPAVELKQLSIEFTARSSLFSLSTKVRAVKNIDLVMPLHSVTGLVGESGSGKSTIARLIAGAIRPTSGELFFYGEKVTYGTKKAKSTFSTVRLVFQDPLQSFNPRLTIYQQLMEIAYYSGIERKTTRCHDFDLDQAVRCKIHEVGLRDELLPRYPHQVSQGQLQRFSIARALLSNPQILLFDESLASLDITIQVQVLNLLKKLRDERGLTYLFISHDIRLIKAFCDRAVVVLKGEIVEQGDTQSILRDPKHEYTKKIVQALF
jgi:ABC-type glutathione transport system ATPase component